MLFELTIPNELKSGLAQVDNLVLVVDAESAAYPWELMSAGDKPLCLTKALVRQLQTSNYRPQIGARAGTAAYVVGDPLVSPPFRQLPGAADEAVAVHGLLSAKFDVNELLSKPTALEVLAGLYKKPYRIVHLAGHGHYESPTTPGGKARSGMVLDSGLFLTAVEVGQMQQVPELVFLNCCHIGQTGPQAAPRTPAVEFNRLAASVSRELIEMGVRAVVAAGWAVEDTAAKLFAEVFYGSMLDGEPFGRALKKARDDTYARFPESNTWGAYQAYGDPDYRLDPTSTGGVASSLGNVDAAEFIEAVRDIGRRAEEAGSANGSPSAAVRSLKALVADCPSDWLAQTDVLMEIGYAYGRLGQFESAGEYLAAALAGDGDNGTTTLRAVAELANFEALLADHYTEAQAARTRELHKLAISRLEKLIAVAATSERYSLLGSVYKRRAAAERNARNARQALTQAGEKYHLAHQLSLQRQGLDPYPALNWLAAATLLDQEVPDADALIERCEATASEGFRKDRKFWTAIATADAGLVRALRTGRLGLVGQDGDDELGRLASVYQDVIREAAPTARELYGVGRHIEIIAVLLGRLSPRRPATKKTIARLTELRIKITGDVRAAPGSRQENPRAQSRRRPGTAHPRPRKRLPDSRSRPRGSRGRLRGAATHRLHGHALRGEERRARSTRREHPGQRELRPAVGAGVRTRARAARLPSGPRGLRPGFADHQRHDSATRGRRPGARRRHPAQRQRVLRDRRAARGQAAGLRAARRGLVEAHLRSRTDAAEPVSAPRWPDPRGIRPGNGQDPRCADRAPDRRNIAGFRCGGRVPRQHRREIAAVLPNSSSRSWRPSTRKCRGVFHLPEGERPAAAREIVKEHCSQPVVRDAVWLRLSWLLRETALKPEDWQYLLDYIDRLPAPLADRADVLERRAFALAKKGEFAAAAGLLEQLIDSHGGASERYGLLGGRYKDLMRVAHLSSDRQRYLNKSIESYDKGMRLDLNDYYPASNLPRLYRRRGGRGDLLRADEAAVIATEGCRRAIDLGLDDEWTRATLLGMAFYRGDVAAAKRLKKQVEVDGPNAWKLESTLNDLGFDIEQHQDPRVREELTGIVKQLQVLQAQMAADTVC